MDSKSTNFIIELINEEILQRNIVLDNQYLIWWIDWF